jgi:hypothetical protein
MLRGGRHGSMPASSVAIDHDIRNSADFSALQRIVQVLKV